MNLEKFWNTSVPFEYRVDVPLELCLQRLEAYRKRPVKFGEVGKEIFINFEPIKKNEIYKVELGFYFLSLEVELEANNEGCLVMGQVHYNWVIAPLLALCVFGFYWYSAPIPLTTDNGLFVLIILLGGAFLLNWLVTMGVAGEFKSKLREILAGESASSF